MMIPGFGTLAFMNPWVLAGLAFLPVLWFLLRVTPPAPRLIVFPAAHFMLGLDAQKQVPSKTPWPILLLRILAAGLIILALARPLLNPGETVSGNGPVRIVMDNGWSASQTWRPQLLQAVDIIERAGRERRTLYIVTTAHEPGKTEPAMHGPLTKGDAEAMLRGIKPLPWLSDYDAAAALLETAQEKSGIQSFWLSSGQMDGKPDKLIRTLQTQGGLSFIEPAATQRPVLLRPDKTKAGQTAAMVEVHSGTPAGISLTVQALARDGRLIDSQDIITDGKQLAYKTAFELPTKMQNQVNRMQIAGRQSAGATLLLDSGTYRRSIGITTSSGTEEKAALTDATYYIERALEPYADTRKGTLVELLAQDDISVLVLPDVGAMPPEELDALEGWVREGGLLIRFGGPRMTQGDNFLTPVLLRSGGRTMEGSLSWDKPAKPAPFPVASPFFGLEIPDDLSINRQLLAEPEPELERKSWALLEDGTPLITADNLEDGMIILIHTTATPEWSNLALSGLFVKLMERSIQMAGTRVFSDGTATGTLQPLLVMDGFGNTTQPGATSQPIPAAEFDSKIPDSTHPPGIYGRAGYQKSFNMGERLPILRVFPDMPGSVDRQVYGGVKEKNLMPFILGLALLLFMIDWMVMIIMHAGWHLFSNPLRWSRTAVVAAVIILTPVSAQAETVEDQVRYAGQIHLAYIKTGVSDVDSLAQRGLEGLSQILAQRTSVEPADIVGLNPDTDDLSFFPLIYWAITPGQPTLSGKALQRIQHYLDHGGTVLVDTRDESTTPRGFGGTSGGANASHLRRLTGGLNVPPLILMPKDHVLTKSFYLIDSFPGRYDGQTLWVEETSDGGRDGVSSLIIGSNDWISAWATASSGQTRQQEISMRFGVNLMMYALTGNYKADQVHIPHILERLGQ